MWISPSWFIRHFSRPRSTAVSPPPSYTVCTKGALPVSPWLYLIQQTISSWSLLVSLGFCLGLRKVNTLRLSLAALGCGLVSLAGLRGPGAFRALALLAIMLFSPMAAWPGLPPSRRVPTALCTLTLTLLMAGCARLLLALGLDHTPLALAQALLLPALTRFAPGQLHPTCVTVDITFDSRRISLTALVDSGNLLRDPLTRLPVIVISRRASSRLFPDASELSPGMRLISVRTVAGSTLMPIFRPTELRIRLPQGWQDVHAIVGLSPEGYSGFQALVPSCVLSSSQGGIALCP